MLPLHRERNASLVRELTFLIWPKEKKKKKKNLVRERDSKKEKSRKVVRGKKAQKWTEKKQKCFMPQ